MMQLHHQMEHVAEAPLDSIWIAQNVKRKARNFTGHKFWARGYFVSTVGRDEETIRAYIKNQELQDREMDQLALIP